MVHPREKRRKRPTDETERHREYRYCISSYFLKHEFLDDFDRMRGKCLKYFQFFKA